MLYLNPPYPVINGVTLLPDHLYADQWYMTPMAPKLTMVKDPTSSDLTPQIQLMKYRGMAGDGGFLNFDCNLGLEDDAIKELARELKRAMRLPGDPRIAPLPVIDGTVRMMLFGQESAASPQGGSKPGTAGSTATAAASAAGTTSTDPNAPKFVLKIQNNAKPALYGDNQAAFSVQLDQYGVTVLEKALHGDMSPIGIVYSLDYLALRPAFTVHLSVDWDRLQKRLDEEYGMHGFFVSAQIDKTVDELIEKRVIQLDVDSFVPEGDDPSIVSDRDRAVNEVREMITNAFFASSIDPAKPAEDGWDKANQLLDRLQNGPAGAGGIFQYKNLDYTRIDKKSLEVTMNERTTVRRTIYPQGHLGGLFRILQAHNLDPARYILEVDLDNPWFQHRRVSAVSRADYERDQIGSIDLRLVYGNDARNALLAADSANAKFEWLSQLDGAGAMKRTVTGEYTVRFKDADAGDRPGSLKSGPISTDVENIEIYPRDLYAIMPVPIVISETYPFDRFPSVEVGIRYNDTAAGINFERTFFLAKGKPVPEVRLFLADPTKTQFESRVVHHGADNRAVEWAWAPNNDREIKVFDPFPGARSITVVAAVPWTQVQNVFVDLSHEDKGSGARQEGSVQFAATDQAPKSFRIDFTDPKDQRVGFEATIIFTNGRVVQVPRSHTLDRRIIVRGDMAGHRVVRMTPSQIDFAGAGLREVRVESRYVDQAAGISFAGGGSFARPDDVATFEFDYVDPGKQGFEYRTVQAYLNGLSKETEWQAATADDVIVPINA
jgi:hypothetical protein